MVGTFTLYSALAVGCIVPEIPPTKVGAESYQTVSAKTPRDANSQVQLALWCERQGLDKERIRHLAIAVLADPTHAAARGLLGKVLYRGKWTAPGEVAQQVKNDPELSQRLEDYRQRRAKAKNTVASQWELALWCKENWLEAEYITHLTLVTYIDSNHEHAWHRLGYKKYRGRWLTEVQIQKLIDDENADKAARRKWTPLFEEWRKELSKPETREQAESGFATVQDPRAVPVVYKSLATGTLQERRLAVQVLGQIQSPSSSRLLATLAASDPSNEVRRIAVETLVSRDPLEFAHVLIRMMREPIKFQVQNARGVGRPPELVIEGPKYNLKRVYSSAQPPLVEILPGDIITIDPVDGLPLLNRTIRMDVGTAGQQPLATLLAKDGFDVLNQNLQSRDLISERAIAGMMRENDPSLSREATHRRIAISAGQQFSWATYQKSWVARKQMVETIHETEAFWLASLDRTEIRIRRLGIQSLIDGLSSGLVLQIPIGHMMREADRSLEVAQSQLDYDVKLLEGVNLANKQINSWFRDILQQATGKTIEPEREAWEEWFVDRVGYKRLPKPSRSKPTIEHHLPIAYVPVPVTVDSMLPIPVQSCFPSGTPVHTFTGTRAIESLEPGDQVLSQDCETGVLSYQSILRVLRNPPMEILRIKLGDEVVRSSQYHRFWIAGIGWRMARELKPGDRIRRLDKVVSIASIELEPEEPVFNLEVAANNTFFVDQKGLLVHDNTFAEPVVRTL